MTGRVPIHKRPHATETEAAERIAPQAGKLRDQVLAVILGAGERGATPSEVIAALDRGRARHGREPVNPYSVRPRVTELWQGGAIKVVGRRPNPRGNREEVYVTGYDDSDEAEAARRERHGYRVQSWKKEAQRLQAGLDRLREDPAAALVRAWLGIGEPTCK